MPFKILSVYLLALILFGQKAVSNSTNKTRIAIIYPQNPKVKDFTGNSAVCFTEKALEYFRAKGLPLTWTFQDNMRSVSKTFAIANDLKREKWDIIIGGSRSEEAIVTGNALKGSKSIYIAPTASNPEVTKNKPNAFSLAYNDSYQAKVIADFTLNKMNEGPSPKRKILIPVNLSRPYSVFLTKEITRLLLKKNPQIAIETVSFIEGNLPIQNLRNKINETKSDTLILTTLPPVNINIYNEIKNHNRNYLVVGSDVTGGRKYFLDAIAPESNRIQYFYTSIASSKNIAPSKISKLYNSIKATGCKDYSEKPFTKVAFETIYNVLDTLEKSGGNFEYGSFIKNFYARKLLFLGGETKFDPHRFASRQINLLQIKNGESINVLTK